MDHLSARPCPDASSHGAFSGLYGVVPYRPFSAHTLTGVHCLIIKCSAHNEFTSLCFRFLVHIWLDPRLREHALSDFTPVYGDYIECSALGAAEGSDPQESIALRLALFLQKIHVSQTLDDNCRAPRCGSMSSPRGGNVYIMIRYIRAIMARLIKDSAEEL